MDGLNNNYRRVRRITIVNKSIILSDKYKQELAKYAESEKPYESCAILVGNETDENWTVKELVLTENTAKSEVTFTISPDKEFEVDQKAKESNMEIVCIFHSHPESEAYPSETDKKIHESKSISMDNLFRQDRGNELFHFRRRERKTDFNNIVIN